MMTAAHGRTASDQSGNELTMADAAALTRARIAVFGAGAIGGYLAARLASAGAQVTVIARGAHLAAMQQAGGLVLAESDGATTLHRVCAVGHAREAGVQDVVILGMKAHQVADVVDDVRTMLGERTLVVTTQNGIPWWYFHGIDTPWRDRVVESVDPGGVIVRALPADRTIGCIVYPAAEIAAPGHVRVVEGNRFALGEIDGSDTPRLRALVALFRDAGFKCPVLKDIRAEIWLKLWGNLSFNPISALTRATLEDICTFAPTRALAAQMMAEAQAVGERLGVRFKVSIGQRIAGAQAVGAHRTSMLHDVEAGRPTELAALVGSVIELAGVVGVPVPTIEHVHGLVALLTRPASGPTSAPAPEATSIFAPSSAPASRPPSTTSSAPNPTAGRPT